MLCSNTTLSLKGLWKVTGVKGFIKTKHVGVKY